MKLCCRCRSHQALLVWRFAAKEEAGIGFVPALDVSLCSATRPSASRERMETWGLLCVFWGNVNAGLEVLGPVSGLNLWNYSFGLKCFFMGKLEAHQELLSVWVCSCFLQQRSLWFQFFLEKLDEEGLCFRRFPRAPRELQLSCCRSLFSPGQSFPVHPLPQLVLRAGASPCPAPAPQEWGWAAALTRTSGSSNS